MTTMLSSTGSWPADAGVAAFLLGIVVLTNVVVLAAVARKRVLKSPGFERIEVSDFFILQISFADCMFGLLHFVAINLSHGRLVRFTNACLVSSFAINVPFWSSLYHLVALAYSRYSILKDPLHSGMSMRSAWIWTVVIYATGLAIWTSNIISGQAPAPSAIYCRRANAGVSGILTLMFIFLPSMGIFLIYFLIVRRVRRDTVGDDVTRRISKMALVLNVVYTFAFFPFGGSGLYSTIVGEFVGPALDSATWVLTITNYLVNPWVYCYYQKKYRRAVYDITGIRYVLRLLGYEESVISSLGVSGSKDPTISRKSHQRGRPVETIDLSSLSIDATARGSLPKMCADDSTSSPPSSVSQKVPEDV